MQQFVSTRLAAQLQRRTEAHAYTDLAYYIPTPDTTTLDEYGQPTPSATLVPISCSFSDNSDRPNVEKWTGIADIEEIAAVIRFSSPSPTKGGRVKIAKRFGSPVTERTFEVIGIQDRGVFGFVCALKDVSL
jgi:hypothetical protein